MTRDELLRALNKAYACSDAVEWVRTCAGTDPRDGQVLLQRLWEDCTQPEWMLWYLETFLDNSLFERRVFLYDYLRLLCKRYGDGIGFTSETARSYIDDFRAWLCKRDATLDTLPPLPERHCIFREIEQSDEDDPNLQMTAAWGVICFLYGFALIGADEDPDDAIDEEEFETHYAGEVIEFEWFCVKEEGLINADDIRAIWRDVLYPKVAE